MNVVEVDPDKTCSRRYVHRDVNGVDTDTGRICPACTSEAETPTA